MPLLEGSSKKVRSMNVDELVKSFKRTGKIGTSHPSTVAKAQKQAVAIAYSKVRKGRK